MSQLENAQTEYENFAQQFESVILSTVSETGMPNASYAPFVMDEAKNLYIYVSGLSTHTQNLHANPRVSVLLIEDETTAEQVFARRRLNYECLATPIDRETEEWNQIVARFERRFGQIIDVLRGLSDFRIFKLTPQEGRFVVGFGAAYGIRGENLNQLVPLRG